MTSDQEQWTVLASETVFAARPWVVVTRERVRTGAGQIVDDFYRVDLAPFVVCVPQLPSGEIVTLWGYKHGPGRWGMSFPAGYVDAGEQPAAASARELIEETGYEPTTLTHLGEFVDNGNQRGCVGNYYVARGCRLVAAPASGDLEQIDVRLMTPDAIDRALADGDISVIHHVAAWGLARPHLNTAER